MLQYDVARIPAPYVSQNSTAGPGSWEFVDMDRPGARSGIGLHPFYALHHHVYYPRPWLPQALTCMHVHKSRERSQRIWLGPGLRHGAGSAGTPNAGAAVSNKEGPTWVKAGLSERTPLPPHVRVVSAQHFLAYPSFAPLIEISVMRRNAGLHLRPLPQWPLAFQGLPARAVGPPMTPSAAAPEPPTRASQDTSCTAFTMLYSFHHNVH